MELEEDYVILDAVSTIQEVVLTNEAHCVAFKESYGKYQYLWKNDLQTTLAEFIHAQGTDGDDPELAMFDQEISKYKAVQEEIQALSTTQVTLNSKP